MKGIGATIDDELHAKFLAACHARQVYAGTVIKILVRLWILKCLPEDLDQLILDGARASPNRLSRGGRGWLRKYRQEQKEGGQT